ncbi:GNAT family N-acetyltransferase [Alkalihalobacillus sp. 1P02AB]|uniref:GNAT family N-acetyltransferase n=1 Tax=Alkalihalobacillus sp. 1P02AB TaxID=3132260 RepID=UPI0039A70AB1
MNYFLTKGRLKLRVLEKQDRHLLLKWLTDDRVLPFYEGRDSDYDREKIEKDFYGDGPGEVKSIIEFDRKRIGYLQFYPVNTETSVIKDYQSDMMVYGLDQFIGEPTYWNKGIGTKLIQTMLEYLIEEKEAEVIIMDPRIDNERAIACYKKCGFEIVRRLPKQELHEGEYRDCWLMEYRVKK